MPRRGCMWKCGCWALPTRRAGVAGRCKAFPARAQLHLRPSCLMPTVGKLRGSRRCSLARARSRHSGESSRKARVRATVPWVRHHVAA
jgi:hypothetical protein